MAGLGGKEESGLLLEAFLDPDKYVSDYALEGLRRVVIPWLIEQVINPGSDFAHGAGKAMVSLGVSALPHLQKLARHPSSRTRQHAAKLLGEMSTTANSEQLTQALIPLLHDNHPLVQSEAATALKKIHSAPLHRSHLSSSRFEDGWEEART